MAPTRHKICDNTYKAIYFLASLYHENECNEKTDIDIDTEALTSSEPPNDQIFIQATKGTKYPDSSKPKITPRDVRNLMSQDK